jgi:hypothetical protein
MTENTEQSFESTEQNVEIGIEQILASVLATIGEVTVDINTILTNFGTYQVGVEQDEETKAITFKLLQKEDLDA